MALDDCLKKFGSAVSPRDVKTLREAIAGGVSEQDAVARLLSDTENELQHILDLANEQGGKVYAESVWAEPGRAVYNLYDEDEIPGKGRDDLREPRSGGKGGVHAPAALQGLQELAENQKVGTVRSAIRTVESPEDLAHVTDFLRQKAQETFVAVVTDKGGKVLAIHRHTLGGRTGASVYPGVIAGAIHSTPKAAKVWFSHNHPSGLPDLSPADRNITDKLHDLLRGSGIEVGGIIAVGRNNTAGFYSPGSGQARTVSDTSGGERKARLPLYEIGLLRYLPEDAPEITDPRSATRAVEDMPPGILLLNGQHQIVGYLPTPEEDFSTLRAGSVGSGVSRILQAAHQANADAAIVKVASGLRFGQNIGSALTAADVRVLDIIDDEGVSAARQGRELTSGSTFYQSRNQVRKRSNTEAGGFKGFRGADGFLTVYGDVESIRAKLPEGVKGRPVTGGLVFTPNHAHRVEAALKGEKRTYSRGGRVTRHRKGKDGKYIGASQANNTPDKLRSWRKKFRQLAMEGEPGRFWYENSGTAILEMTGGDVAEAKKFIALLAIYSPQAAVVSNSTFALRAWAQYKAGQPISVKTRVQDGAATEVLYKGKPWGGEKTNNFYINLLREVDPNAGEQGATIDLWMMRAGMYDHVAPTDSEYHFMENEVNRMAAELGWEPQQVQAAVWVAMKARMENPAVKKKTEEVSLKRKWIRFDQVMKNGKPKKQRVILDSPKHTLNWIKHGMAHELTPEDTNRAKFDFSDGVRRHVGQVSWEARPGETTGILPGIHTAPYEQQLEFQQAIQEALAGPHGEDLLAQYLGLLADGSLTAPGVWQGSVSPSAQAAMGMAPVEGAAKSGAGMDVSQKAVLDVYSAALGLLLRQEGVAYHKPFFGESLAKSNGIEMRLGRPLTDAEARAIADAMTAALSERGLSSSDIDDVGLVSSPKGMRVINYGDKIPNKELHKLASDVFGATLAEDVSVDPVAFLADGNLVSNDWKENSNGEGYKGQISSAGRSDVLGWSAVHLAPKVQKVFEEFSEKYGWGDPGQIPLDPQTVELDQSARANTYRVFRGERNRNPVGEFNTRLASLSFTPSRELADAYAQEPNSVKPDDRTDIDPTLREYDVTVENPWTDDPGDPFVDFAKVEEALGEGPATAELLDRMGWRLEGTNIWQEEVQPETGAESILDAYEKNPELLREKLYVDIWPLLDDEVFVAALQEAGFDGAIYGSAGRGAHESEVRAFDARQVKPVRELYQPAYHGTPHIFDKFTLDRIGTGEGAQAFGWGLYFAQRESIARFYRDKLVGRKKEDKRWTLDGKEFDPSTVLDRIGKGSVWDDAYLLNVALSFFQDANFNNAEAKKLAQAEYESHRDDFTEGEWATIFDFTGRVGVTPEAKGVIKKVDIPEDDVLLDYDAPFSEQPEKVRAAIEGLFTEEAAETGGLVLLPNGRPLGAAHGWDIYKSIGVKYGGGNEGASRKLLEAGIPGLRYLDRESRSVVASKVVKKVTVNGKTYRPKAFEQKGPDALTAEEMAVSLVLSNGSAAEAVKSVQGIMSTYGHMIDPRFRERNEAAIKFLQENKFDVETKDERTRNYVIWDEDAIDVIEDLSQTLNADGASGEGRRGFIDITDPKDRIIALSQTSDLSTFLHESAHLFLEIEREVARDFGVDKNQQAILDYLGVNSFDEIGVEHHEKFAETFEAYLREGAAPAPRLQRVFTRFRSWLLNIYKRLSSLGRSNLNDEARQMFDRLLATDEEIAAAKAHPLYEELYRSKEQAGMSDQEWAKYQENQRKREEAAVRKVDATLLDELQKRLSKEWATERKEIEEDVLEEVAREPIQQVREALKSGRLNREQVEAILGEKPKGKLNQATSKTGDLDPAVLAEEFGYKDDVEGMLRDINEAPTAKERAKEIAEERMIARHGDVLNDGTAARMAAEALQNGHNEELLIQEVRALSRGRDPINRDVLKAEAAKMIASMTYKEIRPGKYYHAMVKWAKKAATSKGDDAVNAKIQQLANHYLYREAEKVRRQMEKHRKFVRAAQNRSHDPRQVAVAYGRNIPILARLYDVSQNAQADVEALLNWYEGQFTAGENDATPPVMLELLDPQLVDALEKKRQGELHAWQPVPFEQMTAEQLHGLVSMLRHMRFVGGKMADVQKAKFNAAKAALSRSIQDEGGDDRPVKPTKTGWEEWKERGRNFMFGLSSLRNLIRHLDGYLEDGEAFRRIFQPLKKAEDRKLELTRELYHRFEEEMDGIHRIGLGKKDRRTFRLNDGRSISLSSEERFMMALYWGTESSREAIRDGYGMTDTDVEAVLRTLTPEQLRMVNATWRVNESMWPALSGASVDMYGVAPPKLPAAPFEVNGVQMTGGHMRLYYESFELEIASERQIGGDFAKVVPSKAGSLHSRVGSGGRPVSLDRNNIIRSLDEAVHFVAYSGPAREVASLLNSRDVRGAIVEKHGDAFARALKVTIDGLTGYRPDRTDLPRFLVSLLRAVRTAATFKYLAYSLRNTVQQFTSFPIAMQEVGVGPYIASLLRVTGNRFGDKSMIDMVNEKSEFMKNRASLVNRETREFMKKIDVDGRVGHAWNLFKNYGFAPQTAVDSLIAYPLWVAKYDQEMAAHGDEARASTAADVAVSESVGSGSDLHLGGMFQKNRSEAMKTLTVFGSWFNAYFNRIQKATKGGSEFATAEALNTIFTMPIIVALISAALIMDVPDDDGEDDEGWLMWALTTYASFMGGTVPVLRDVFAAFSGMPVKSNYSGAVEGFGKIPDEVRAMFEGKQSGLKTASDVSKIVTSFVPAPGIGNVHRVVDYLDSYNQGREMNEPDTFFGGYQAIVEGKNRN